MTCGQVEAGFEPLVAEEMEGEVLVAEAEPVLAAEAFHFGEDGPGFAGAAPAGVGVVDAGEAVEDGVDVGADGEAPVFEVVAGVDDDGERGGGQCCLQAGREFGPADTAGEGHDRGVVIRFWGHWMRVSYCVLPIVRLSARLPVRRVAGALVLFLRRRSRG